MACGVRTCTLRTEQPYVVHSKTIRADHCRVCRHVVSTAHVVGARSRLASTAVRRSRRVSTSAWARPLLSTDTRAAPGLTEECSGKGQEKTWQLCPLLHVFTRTRSSTLLASRPLTTRHQCTALSTRPAAYILSLKVDYASFAHPIADRSASCPLGPRPDSARDRPRALRGLSRPSPSAETPKTCLRHLGLARAGAARREAVRTCRARRRWMLAGRLLRIGEGGRELGR